MLTPLGLFLAAGAVLVSAFIKGAIGFGFPTLATPLLSLLIDVKAAVAILILPNLVMDAIQVLRGRRLRVTFVRLRTLLVFGMLGTFVGTRVLLALPPRVATGILGGFILVFVALNATRLTLRVPVGAERWLSPVVGLVAGIVGGITNVPGTPLVIYFYALRMEKVEFVSSVAFSFLVYKTTQLAAVVYFGLLPPARFAWSLAVTVLALITFWAGMRLQDRFDQATFNRVVLGFLAALALLLIARSLA